jgi:hypothetical protein
MHLSIDGVTFLEPCFELAYRIVCVTLEYVKMADALSAEEWASHCTMEPNSEVP